MMTNWLFLVYSIIGKLIFLCMFCASQLIVALTYAWSFLSSPCGSSWSWFLCLERGASCEVGLSVLKQDHLGANWDKLAILTSLVFLPAAVGNIRNSKFTLSIFSFRFGFSYFSKNNWFLWLGNRFKGLNLLASSKHQVLLLYNDWVIILTPSGWL